MSAPQDVPGPTACGVASLTALGPTPSPARLARSPDRRQTAGADDGSTGCAHCMLAHPPKGCTTRASSTTRAVSRSWPRSPARPATTSWRRRSPPCATSTTAARPAPRPTPATGPGILLQVPDAFLRDVVDFELPPLGAYAVGTAFLEGDADDVAKTRQRIEELADEEGLTVLGWRDVPVDPDQPRRDRARRDAAVQPAVRRRPPGVRHHRDGAGADGVLPAQARRARDRRLLRLAQRPHPALQGHAHHRPARRASTPTSPTSGSRPRWPSSTRASPPTRSRAGRWPTRSATSPTTARSTP